MSLESVTGAGHWDTAPCPCPELSRQPVPRGHSHLRDHTPLSTQGRAGSLTEGKAEQMGDLTSPEFQEKCKVICLIAHKLHSL